MGIADCSLTPDDEFFGVETIFVQNTLTDFSATIDGFDWDGGFPNWWGDEASGQAPGHQSSSRTNISIQENGWFFGDPFMGERQMTMDIDEFSDTFGQGSWGQSVVLNTGFIEGSGTWQAVRVETTNPQVPPTEAVPEPSTISSILMAMGLAYASRKKQIRKIYHNIK